MHSCGPSSTHKQLRLLQVLPTLPDLQVAWLLLLYCASPRSNYTSALCQHYRGGKSYPKCSVCAEHEGSMLDHQ